MFSYVLEQMPQHSSQPVEQSKPTLRQEQRIVSYPMLQLHAIISAALLEQHPCHLAGAVVDTLLLSSQDSVDADVDHALIPTSILAPEGKHGWYGTR